MRVNNKYIMITHHTMYICTYTYVYLYIYTYICLLFIKTYYMVYLRGFGGLTK